MPEIVINRTVGKNLREIMARTLARNTFEVFKEFGSNAYDADAKRFDITLEDILTFEDDGSGMDEVGLIPFFRLGDSEKVDNPYTPSGRRKIGKFGIATVLLEYLGGEYVLDTWKGGEHITLRENFRSSRDTNAPLEYTVEECDPHLHGTRIQIADLRFLEDTAFSVTRLKRTLALEMPIGDGFEIYFGREKVSRPKVEPTAIFYFSEDLPSAGKIRSEVKYFEEGAPDPGVFVRVHKRVIGDPQAISIGSEKRLTGKVTVEVDADGLSEVIAFQGSGFQEGNPAYRELKSEIGREIRVLRQSVDELARERLLERINEQVPKAVEVATNLARGILAREEKAPETEGISLSDLEKATKTWRTEQVPGIIYDGSLRFTLSTAMSPDGPLGLLGEGGEIFINQKHPYFRIDSGGMKGSDLPAQMIYAASCILAESLALSRSEDPKVKKTLDERTRMFAQLAEKVFEGSTGLQGALEYSRNKRSRGNFNPNRLYDKSELSETGKFRRAFVNRLLEARVIEPLPENGLFLGSDLIDLFEQTKGHTPVMNLLYDYLVAKTTLTREGRRQAGYVFEDNLAMRIDEINYLRNIGKTMPLVLVEDGCVDKFNTLLDLGLLPYKKADKSKLGGVLPKELASRDGMYMGHYSTLGRCIVELGTDLEGVLTLMDKAMRSGQGIRFVEQGRVKRYNVGDLRRNKT